MEPSWTLWRLFWLWRWRWGHVPFPGHSNLLKNCPGRGPSRNITSWTIHLCRMGIWRFTKVRQVVKFVIKVYKQPNIWFCLSYSWLLRDDSIHIRTSEPNYMKKVKSYFDRLLPILKNLQFSTGQGPIIAFQVLMIQSPIFVSNFFSAPEYNIYCHYVSGGEWVWQYKGARSRDR